MRGWIVREERCWTFDLDAIALSEGCLKDGDGETTNVWPPSRSVIWQVVKYRSESSVNFTIYTWSYVTRELMIRTFFRYRFSTPSSKILLSFSYSMPFATKKQLLFALFFKWSFYYSNLLNEFVKKKKTVFFYESSKLQIFHQFPNRSVILEILQTWFQTFSKIFQSPVQSLISLARDDRAVTSKINKNSIKTKFRTRGENRARGVESRSSVRYRSRSSHARHDEKQ